MSSVAHGAASSHLFQLCTYLLRVAPSRLVRASGRSLSTPKIFLRALLLTVFYVHTNEDTPSAVRYIFLSQVADRVRSQAVGHRDRPEGTVCQDLCGEGIQHPHMAFDFALCLCRFMSSLPWPSLGRYFEGTFTSCIWIILGLYVVFLDFLFLFVPRNLATLRDSFGTGSIPCVRKQHLHLTRYHVVKKTAEPIGGHLPDFANPNPKLHPGFVVFDRNECTESIG